MVSEGLESTEAITRDARGGSFIWNAEGLDAAYDYSLEITQEKEYSIDPARSDAYASTTLRVVSESSAIASASNVRSTTPVIISSLFTVPSGSITTIYITGTANSIINSSSTPISSKTSNKNKNKKIAIAVSFSIGVIVLLVLGYYIIHQYRSRKKTIGNGKFFEKENNHIETENVNSIQPAEPAELSGHQEHELSGHQEHELSGHQEHELSGHQEYELSGHQEYELSTGARIWRPELPG